MRNLPEFKVRNCYCIELQVIIDSMDGNLCVIEGSRNLPFEIKRVYFIHNLTFENAVRGKHAHKLLEQVLFCIQGSFTMELDDGLCKEEIVIDKPSLGIFIGRELWHTMKNFSKDCILLVFASDYYNESDYIRDYDQFIKYTSKQHDFVQQLQESVRIH